MARSWLLGPALRGTACCCCLLLHQISRWGGAAQQPNHHTKAIPHSQSPADTQTHTPCACRLQLPPCDAGGVHIAGASAGVHEGPVYRWTVQADPADRDVLSLQGSLQWWVPGNSLSRGAKKQPGRTSAAITVTRWTRVTPLAPFSQSAISPVA